MLGSILKPDWQSDSVDKRLSAVGSLNPKDEKHQLILQELVAQDSEPQVRYAALHKLTDLELLWRLLQDNSDAELAEHVKVRFTSLIGAHSELSEAEFKTLLATHPESRELIAQHCPHGDLRQELIAAMSIADQVVLLDGLEYTDTRQLIANQLQEVEHLELARKLLKGRDKQAEKIIKAKLDKLHAQQRLEQETAEAAENICEKIEFLASHDWRPEFTANFHVWQQRWQELPLAPDQQLEQRFNAASEAVGKIVAQHELTEQCQTTQKELLAEIQNYCERVAGRSKKKLLKKQNKLNKKTADLVEKWQKSSAQVAPQAEHQKQFNTAQQSLGELSRFCLSVEQADALEDEQQKITAMQSALAVLAWPSHFPDLQIRAKVEEEIAELKQEQREQQQATAELLDKLHKRINRLLGVTRRGELARAKNELAAITKAVGKYEGKDKAALEERLETAATAVKKMGDWKDFATEPKFIELCTAMEALVDSKMKPTKLANKINDLQQQWKNLGYAESADEHWPRFKEAADKAYQPCAEFFAKQREMRKQNLQEREPLVKQMQDLLENTDWEGEVDYKQVEAELRRIANAWQKIKDVERAAGQKQWNRLSKIRAAIYEKLDVVYDANIKLKQQLLEQAQALAESEVTEQSLGKLQLYQRKWKEVGITRRKQDQAVWRKFKKATDNVYQQIQDGRKSKRAEEDAQIAAYRDIITQIQQLAKTGKELAAIDAGFEQLQADYRALPELPKNLPEKLVQKVQADFKRANAAYNKARERIIQSGQQQELTALQHKAELCTQLESLGAKAKTDKIEKLQNKIAAIELNNTDYTRRFEQRLSAALESDRAKATEQRRLMCIDLEILLGADSPAEDSALRTKIQLERMQKQGIGHAEKPNPETLQNLKIDWLCLPGAEPEQQIELDKRFAKLLK